MRDVSDTAPVDWLKFKHPDEDKYVWVNLSFLASNWGCQYGKGCPGLFGEESAHIFPDLGCCGKGAYITDSTEQKQIDGDVKRLTPHDWDSDLRDAYMATGKWAVVHSAFHKDEYGDEYGSVKTRVVDGACIFANRTGGSAGKPGCAFLHLSQRLSKDGIDIGHNEGHIDHMPTVCWQLPLKVSHDEDANIEITAWSTNEWTRGRIPTDTDGTTDSWAKWWCVDSPDAYNNDRMLVVSMKRELTRIVGETAYGIILDAVLDRKHSPMPAAMPREKMLPLVAKQTITDAVGDRIPQAMTTVELSDAELFDRERLLSYDLDRFADRRFKRERVAILTMSGTVIEIPNDHHKPHEHFSVTVLQAKSAVGSLKRIWAILHTHPPGSPGRPSPDDLDRITEGVLGVVYHVQTGSLVLYRHNHIILTIRRK